MPPEIITLEQQARFSTQSALVYDFLNKTKSNPVSELIEKVSGKPSPDPKKIIICAQCGSAITSEEEKISINGSIYHVFTNPYGYTFNLICFHDALGCLFEGTLVAADTWFPGYYWQYATCSNCNTHLGWYYTSGSTKYFYGLIAERICNTQNEH